MKNKKQDTFCYEPTKLRRRQVVFWGLGLSLTPIAGIAYLNSKKNRLPEGVELVKPPVPTNNHFITVWDFFSYSCPHCRRFFPLIKSLSETENLRNVTIEHVPVIFDETTAFFAYVYYTLQTLDRDDLSEILWDEILSRKIQSSTDLRIWIQKQGIETKVWDRAFDSQDVFKSVSRAQQLTQSCQITATPVVVIEGKYKVAPHLVGGRLPAIDVIKDILKNETR